MTTAQGIYYELHGKENGLPIVFIHGFPFSRELWTRQVEAFEASCRIVTYDLRGHGKTGSGDGQYTIEESVDDLIGVLDAAQISQAVIAGLSMGGYIALRAYERHPERFRGLVLCDTKSEADTNEAKIKRSGQVRSIRQSGLKEFTEPFLKGAFSPATFQSQPAVVEAIRGIINQTSPKAVIGTLIALAARTDTTASLEKIAVPTLIMVGEHDGITPPAASQAMKEKIPGSEMHILPNAGHLSNMENTKAFNEHLGSFLGRIASP